MQLTLVVEYDDTLVGAQYIVDRQFEIEGVESVEIKGVTS